MIATTLALSVVIGVVAGCSSAPSAPPAVVTGGDSERGLAAIERYGCASCHSIPGVQRAESSFVGPPLTKYARRGYIAGVLENNETNLRLWIMDPKGVNPSTAMPDLDVSEIEARDITAYLYSLR
ncbi:MAG: c-type cytochrome [Actinobacteria bacterium]|nr:c-type cytochrome [Actinomycetota bacterium]